MHRLVNALQSLLAITALLPVAYAAPASREWLPTGQWITPTALVGTHLEVLGGSRPVGQAMSVVRSHDGKTLAVLTSGFNRQALPDGTIDLPHSLEKLFLYDLAAPVPKLQWTLDIENSFLGLAFAPDDRRLYVSGGRNDLVRVFERADSGWVEQPPAVLRNGVGLGLLNGDADIDGNVPALTAGLAVSTDGSRLVVANYENDSISVVDLATLAVRAIDLRPGKVNPADVGKAGGEFPLDVVLKGNDLAFVSSVRDREVVVVDLANGGTVRARIPVRGNPNRMILDRAAKYLYVSVDQTDRVEVIDTERLRIVGGVTVRTSAALHRDSGRPGAGPNALALSPDEKRLYVTLGGENALAVIAVDAAEHEYDMLGTLPTAWYPDAVAVSMDGRHLYVASGKTPIGPNRGNCAANRRPELAPSGCPFGAVLRTSGDYPLQRVHATLATLPVPGRQELMRLTRQVAVNNGIPVTPDASERRLFSELRKRIRHVVYVVKENRTYDQVLGDLEGANGAPELTQFGRVVTPNEHAMASQFVTLDAFFCAGEVSMQGWQWSVGGRTVDITERTAPINYAKRGASYDSEGTSRGINVALSVAERQTANPAHGVFGSTDPDLLPGTHNEMELDGPEGQPGLGYLWDAALRANKTVRNYGFYGDLSHYDLPAVVDGVTLAVPPLRDPRATGTRVMFPAHPSLLARTDPYFRSFDTKLPDFWREREWEIEFSEFEAHGNLPNLSLVRLMNDHTGSFKTALDGVNTPELQIADNDYAVGKLVERIAHSPFANSTLIVIVEDDAQDGPDHVDAHRSPAFLVGPYVKQGGAVVSTRYTTVDVLRTIEEVLGLTPMNAHDEVAHPMADVFDLSRSNWTFSAKPSPLLWTTSLPLPASAVEDQANTRPMPLHDALWWDHATSGFDLTRPDAVDPSAFNRVLWEGTTGRPMPSWD